MIDDERDDDLPEDEYVSGPYCRHWSDPADCDERCSRCGGFCRDHDAADHEWEEPPE